MRKSIASGALLVALILPSVAVASSGSSAAVGLPISPAGSATIPPPGFSSNADQAIAAAEATPTMQALHRREHPLDVRPLVWAGKRWFIDFSYRGKEAAEVDVSPAGKVTAVWTGPLAIAVYARGHFSPLFDSWWVVVPFSLLFLAPFLDPRRLRRLVHLDAVVLLSFLVSYALFDHTHLEAAVWLAYPPLLYLLARMGAIGWRRSERDEVLSPLLSPRVLGIGLLVLLAARIGLSFASREVADVGFASVIGAHRAVHGQALYYAAAAHSDTYGPIAYLAYVPFELLFPWSGSWDYLLSAHVASIAFDLVTVLGLVVLGRRLRHGREGRRLGLALAWAWAACPFTLLGLMMHTNDGLVAMLSVLSLVVFSSPAARGAMLGLAAAAKFSPAALLPLLASHRDRGVKGMIVCAAAFTAVVTLAIGFYLPSGGLSELYNHTIGFQLSRADVFSPWALHPGLAPLKMVIEAAAILFAGAVAFVPRRRSLVQVSALAAAVTIAVQLPAVHWFYYYIVWFMPFALVALLAAQPASTPAGVGPATTAEEPAPSDVRAPALAGV